MSSCQCRFPPCSSGISTEQVVCMSQQHSRSCTRMKPGARVERVLSPWFMQHNWLLCQTHLFVLVMCIRVSCTLLPVLSPSEPHDPSPQIQMLHHPPCLRWMVVGFVLSTVQPVPTARQADNQNSLRDSNPREETCFAIFGHRREKRQHLQGAGQ